MSVPPVLEALADACGTIMAVYAFAFTPDDMTLSDADLDELADRLVCHQPPKG